MRYSVTKQALKDFGESGSHSLNKKPAATPTKPKQTSPAVSPYSPPGTAVKREISGKSTGFGAHGKERCVHKDFSCGR